MRQNMIDVIEGVSSLHRLKDLNLSFNRITKIEGLQNNFMLEIIELGKNYISDVDALQGLINKFPHLQELYLYMNQIRHMPNKLSFPQLKTLNLNKNTDLADLSLGYNPMLEHLMASQCALKELTSLQSCPNIQQVDFSFNQIETIKCLLLAIHNNQKIVSLSMNDNPFNIHIQSDVQQI